MSLGSEPNMKKTNISQNIHRLTQPTFILKLMQERNYMAIVYTALKTLHCKKRQQRAYSHLNLVVHVGAISVIAEHNAIPAIRIAYSLSSCW